ncbi:YciI family protein [Rhizobium giardinii]|jgi:uncharacterized protein YciI|uniref:YciI family protein n=1 Tax=Rhizobium giardinii TaxID=56731 RepID=UPI000DD9500A
MAYFHLKLVPPRSTFPQDATPEEMAAMERHSAYWRAQADAGRAIAVGPVFAKDGAWGMALVEVPDGNAAQALADGDPVIAASLGFRFEIAAIPNLILRHVAAPAA